MKPNKIISPWYIKAENPTALPLTEIGLFANDSFALLIIVFFCFVL